MALFGNNKPFQYPLLNVSNVEDFKKVSRRELFLKSAEPTVYSIDQGHLIENPRTLWANSIPIYGENLPENVATRKPFRSLPVYSVKFQGSFINPTWGIVLNSNYEVFEPSARAARWKSPDLTQIPGISNNDGAPQINVSLLPKKALRGNYLVLNHWGGKNYGHFLLDSLPGVLLFYKEILQGTLKIITGPLHPWQREYLSMLGIVGPQIVSVERDIFLKCESIVWPSFLHNNLNYPSPFTRIVGVYLRALTGIKGPEPSPDLLYISRASYKDRQLARKLENEEELIRALTQRGFVVIRPEEHSVADQVALFSKAKIIVGESGAGMANIIFAPPGCHIIEIMPEIKNRVWVKQLCGLFDYAWYCVFTAVPPEKRTVTTIQGVKYDNLAFSYAVNTMHVIRAIEEAKSSLSIN